jgi:hypothetical protein
MTKLSFFEKAKELSLNLSNFNHFRSPFLMAGYRIQTRNNHRLYRLYLSMLMIGRAGLKSRSFFYHPSGFFRPFTLIFETISGSIRPFLGCFLRSILVLSVKNL